MYVALDYICHDTYIRTNFYDGLVVMGLGLREELGRPSRRVIRPSPKWSKRANLEANSSVAPPPS